MPKKILAVILLAVGGYFGPGPLVSLPMILLMAPRMPGLSIPLVLVGFAMETIVGLGLLLVGLWLWNWHRWRAVFGKVLIAWGIFACLGILLILDLLFLKAFFGVELFLLGTHAVIAASIWIVVAPSCVGLGIWLVRRQKKVDLAAT